MKNIRVAIIVVIVLVVSFFLGSAIRSYYLFLKEPVSDCINALPHNAAVVIKTHSVQEFFGGMDKSGWSEAFKSNDSYRTLRLYIDTLAAKNKEFGKILKEEEVVFAFLRNATGNAGLLTVAPIGKTGTKGFTKDLKESLGKGYSVVKTDHGLYRVVYKTGSVWYYLKQGLLAVSSDSALVQESYNTLSSDNGLQHDTAFVKLLATGGKRVEGTVLIQTAEAAVVLWPEKADLLKNTPFAEWTSFDINMHDGEVQLGGFTLPGTGHLFEGQQPVEFDQLGDLPGNTAFAITLALSDQPAYVKQFILSDTVTVAGFDASINAASKEIFNVREQLRAWIGNTVTGVYASEYFRGNTEARMIMLQHNNTDSASLFLKPFMQPLYDSLYRFTCPETLTGLWGTAFELDNGEVLCRITPKYVLLSPDMQMLREFGTTSLTGSPDYNVLRESTGTSSNLFIYLQPGIIADWFASASPKAPLSWISFFSGNTSMGMQYSSDGLLQYTHGWLVPSAQSSQPVVRKKQASAALQAYTEPVNPADNSASASAEKTNNSKTTDNRQASPGAADNKPAEAGPAKSKQAPTGIALQGSAKPEVLKTVSGKDDRFIVSGGKRVALHDGNGKQLWEFTSQEQIMPGMQEIRRNGQIQYFVPAKKQFHILDKNGKETAGSPVKLPQPAKGAFAVVDYDRRNDYRILYTGNDNRIYNVTIDGRQPADWQKPSVSGSGTITFYRTGGRDYLIYRDGNKELRIFDRKGNVRIKTEKNLALSSRSELYENKTNSKGIFLGAAVNGDLVYLNTNGSISTSSFGNFEQNPWFSYTDFNGDGSPDFLFASANRIVVFDKMKKVLAEKSTKGNLSTPFVLKRAAGVWLFARNTANGEIVVVQASGKNTKFASLKSDTDPIVVKDPTGGKTEMLVTTLKGKMVFTPL